MALKATIEYTLEHRADYAGISILYGATHATNFTYWHDVEEWQKRDDIELVLTIDRDCEEQLHRSGSARAGAGAPQRESAWSNLNRR